MDIVLKKTAIVFLLFIFLFNTVGYYISFKVMECEIKTKSECDIEQGITIDALTKVVINKNNTRNIEWMDDGKEMRYNGEFYDIVKSTTASKDITYYCINDEEEDVLFAALDDYINTNIADSKPVKNGSSKKLLDHVIKIFFFNEESFSLATTPSLKKDFFSINLFYMPALIETNSPPPEFV